MKSQEYFCKMLIRKSTCKVIQKDIINSGKFISPKIHLVLNSCSKINKALKDHSLSKNLSDRSLGPGRYPTPQPPKVESHRFAQTPRFLDESFGLILSRSCERINDKQLPIVQMPMRTTRELERRIKARDTERSVIKKAKQILEGEKKERILKVLRIKLEKAEYKKFAVIKDAVCKTFAILIVNLSLPGIMNEFMVRRKAYLYRIHAFLRYLSILSRAIGKFVLSKKKVKLLKSWGSLKSILPFLIQRWRIRRTKKVKSTINSAFDSFFERCTIAMVYKKLVKYCVYLQRRARRYLSVLNARRYCLLKFWDKLNTLNKKVHPQIKLELVNKYIHDKLNEHYYSLHKEQKLQLLLNENRHEEYLYEISHQKHRRHTCLRLFIKKDIISLIASASSYRPSNQPENNPLKSTFALAKILASARSVIRPRNRTLSKSKFPIDSSPFKANSRKPTKKQINPSRLLANGQ